MPCNDGAFDAYDRRISPVWIVRTRLDEVTRIACTMAKLIKKNKLGVSLPKEVQNWIKEHEAWDQKRIAKEKREKRGEIKKIENEIKRLQSKKAKLST